LGHEGNPGPRLSGRIDLQMKKKKKAKKKKR
jgi:hypothetical protein